ncbi:CzcE family metal-binding protein [Hydrogenophaga sp. 2FB]|uniref:CzcE family metal-binding protein n=1 Tax=Hydrogenophaga sp. 2FB TaxID=2502187 RepID=UPI00148545F1|nr:CzcE family metal-binding protein [Hydrogenophaga sp. 2FB]
MSKLNTLRQATFAIAIAATLGSASAAGVVGKEQSLIGQPAPAGASARVIDLNSTKHANITYGETVIFRGNDGNQFAWTFNGLGGRSWELAKFAPAGFSDKQYRVYVSLNPLYRK